ncbi:MAG: hypothetical protein AVDCRST_MAG38-2234 [uncultured Solirubrobacteraceae bacterium]|uniref:UspA domain-containing protein n=1 Tax=uncultured Solirubrobacteraceae bacterium TaxID=1162706 RepID=A0A6J4RXL4_9ACTN|nr:MAG: hypothetical protein AVDCRST_MAG38-2234 [uncultured Solirubrobacteraceae bacterium]
MTSPIVVGVHPTRQENEPVELAVMLSCLTHAPLEVVGTYWFDSTPARTAPRDFASRCMEGIREALEDRFDASGACEDVGVTARPGSAAHVIHEVARHADAALIVVGSTHRGPVGRVTLGSTTDRVLEGAPCPVAVAPRGFSDPGRLPARVGVAFADTREGHSALRAGARLARHAGAALVAYTALDGGSATAIREAQAALDSALWDHAGGIAAEGRVLSTGGVAALTEVSQELDFLVTGSRGHGPLRATMLGGVSRRLARDARCPLVVVPRGLDDALAGLFARSAASPA